MKIKVKRIKYSNSETGKNITKCEGGTLSCDVGESEDVRCHGILRDLHKKIGE